MILSFEKISPRPWFIAKANIDSNLILFSTFNYSTWTSTYLPAVSQRHSSSAVSFNCDSRGERVSELVVLFHVHFSSKIVTQVLLLLLSISSPPAASPPPATSVVSVVWKLLVHWELSFFNFTFFQQAPLLSAVRATRARVQRTNRWKKRNRKRKLRIHSLKF